MHTGFTSRLAWRGQRYPGPHARAPACATQGGFMANSNAPNEQNDTLQASLRTLVLQLVPTLQQALRDASTDLAMANDRKQLFAVSEAMKTHQRAFEASFEKLACPPLEATETPTAKASAFGALDLDAIGLVDEAQADREIEVSRTVHPKVPCAGGRAQHRINPWSRAPLSIADAHDLGGPRFPGAQESPTGVRHA
jgi:hypothetical protein